MKIGSKGTQTSEHGLTKIAMITAAVSIVAQIVGQMFFNIDLKIDVDAALLALTGGGGLYTISRGLLKGLSTKKEPAPVDPVTPFIANLPHASANPAPATMQPPRATTSPLERLIRDHK